MDIFICLYKKMTQSDQKINILLIDKILESLVGNKKIDLVSLQRIDHILNAKRNKYAYDLNIEPYDDKNFILTGNNKRYYNQLEFIADTVELSNTQWQFPYSKIMIALDLVWQSEIKLYAVHKDKSYNYDSLERLAYEKSIGESYLLTRVHVDALTNTYKSLPKGILKSKFKSILDQYLLIDHAPNYYNTLVLCKNRNSDIEYKDLDVPTNLYLNYIDENQNILSVLGYYEFKNVLLVGCPVWIVSSESNNFEKLNTRFWNYINKSLKIGHKIYIKWGASCNKEIKLNSTLDKTIKLLKRDVHLWGFSYDGCKKSPFFDVYHNKHVETYVFTKTGLPEKPLVTWYYSENYDPIVADAKYKKLE